MRVPKEFIRSAADIAAQFVEYDDFDEYIHNCIKKYNIDYKTGDGYNAIKALQYRGLLINFMGNIQFIIVKRYLENKNNKQVSDEDVYEFVNKKNSIIDKITSFPIDDLTVEDRAEIYNNMSMIYEIDDRDGFLGCASKAQMDALIKAVQSYDIKYFSNKNNCFINIKNKKNLDDLGLQQYVAEEVPKILQRKTREEEYKERYQNIINYGRLGVDGLIDLIKSTNFESTNSEPTDLESPTTEAPKKR